MANADDTDAVADRQCAAQARSGSSNDCDGRRICSACLQISNCMIDRNGECVSQSAFDVHNDFALVLSRYALPGARNRTDMVPTNRFSYQFRASSATYCAADDAVCSQCTAENFWAPASLNNVSDSRFCVGKDGCVCIFNCQVPSRSQCRQPTTAPGQAPTTALVTTLRPVPTTLAPLQKPTTPGLSSGSNSTGEGSVVPTPTSSRSPRADTGMDLTRSSTLPSDSSGNTKWIVVAVAVAVAFVLGCLVPTVFYRRRRRSNSERPGQRYPERGFTPPVYSGLWSPSGRLLPTAPPLDLEEPHSLPPRSRGFGGPARGEASPGYQGLYPWIRDEAQGEPRRQRQIQYVDEFLEKLHQQERGKLLKTSTGTVMKSPFTIAFNSERPMEKTQLTPGDACRTQYWNSSTECRQPLTCRQCLEIIGCKVNPWGVCVNISTDNSPYQSSYTRAIELNLTLPGAKDNELLLSWQPWNFAATEAAYCPDDDAVCTKCIAEKFWSPFRDRPEAWDARFCMGANGCVCISSCYIPRRCALQSFPPTSPPQASPVPTPPLLSPAPSKIPPNDSRNKECRYVGYGEPCTALRTCSSCLQQKGCRISMSGFCEWDDGDSSHDFRNAIRKNLTVPGVYDPNALKLPWPQEWSFPAFQTTYCSASDTVCKECAQANFWTQSSTSPDSRFCVGTDGCVCIANCVRLEKSSMCLSNEPETGTSYWALRILLVVTAVAAVVSLSVFAYRRRRSMNAPVQETTRPEPSAPPTSPYTDMDVRDDYSFYTSPTGRLEPSAPRTPATHGPLASAPSLHPHPSMPVASAPRNEPAHAGSGSGTSEERPQLELYGWLSHRQHLIDAETRRLNGADDFVPPRNHLRFL